VGRREDRALHRDAQEALRKQDSQLQARLPNRPRGTQEPTHLALRNTKEKVLRKPSDWGGRLRMKRKL